MIVPMRQVSYAVLIFGFGYMAFALIDFIFSPVLTMADREQAATYLTATAKPTPPYSFTHDGCSFFPDILPGLDLRAACLQHDIAYWAGGTSAERKAADRAFRRNIYDAGVLGIPVSYAVYAGVRLFGNSPIAGLTDAEWGYGWDD